MKYTRIWNFYKPFVWITAENLLLFFIFCRFFFHFLKQVLKHSVKLFIKIKWDWWAITFAVIYFLFNLLIFNYLTHFYFWILAECQNKLHFLPVLNLTNVKKTSKVNKSIYYFKIKCQNILNSFFLLFS